MHAEWKFDVGFASNGRRSVQRLQLGRRFSVQDDSAFRTIQRWKRGRRDPQLDLLQLPDGVAAYSAAKEVDARHDELAKASGMMVDSFRSAPNAHLLSWEKRARQLAAAHSVHFASLSQSVAVASSLHFEVSGLVSTTRRWERHMLQLSWLTDQHSNDEYDIYHRLRRVQFELLALSVNQCSVLEMWDGDTEAAMRRNEEAYKEAVRAEERDRQEAVRAKERDREEAVRARKRDRERARRGGLKGGRLAVLPTCDGQYHCVVCPYVASNPEQFRSHVRQKHGKTHQQRAEAERGRFKGREFNVHGASQYAMCVCADGACCVVGTEDWVRALAAQEWQAALGLQ
jgi:hypothetical protein